MVLYSLQRATQAFRTVAFETLSVTRLDSVLETGSALLARRPAWMDRPRNTPTEQRIYNSKYFET